MISLKRPPAADIAGVLLVEIGAYAFIPLILVRNVLPYLGLNPYSWIPITDTILIPVQQFELALGIESGGLVAVMGLFTFLMGLLALRRRIGLRKAILQTILMITPTILFIWSLDFVILDTRDFQNTAIYYMRQVNEVWFTNQFTLYISFGWLVGGMLCYLFVFREDGLAKRIGQ